MSKKVTIPNDGMKPFVVMHNGEKYVYAPGETIDVPDGVALEIEEYKRKKLHGEAIPPFGVGGSGGGSGGASSWNDLEDKPFYEETTVVNEPLNITWDGNTEGLVSVEDADGRAIFCKVSDATPTLEQLQNGGVASCIFRSATFPNDNVDYTIDLSERENESDNSSCVYLGNAVVSVFEDGVALWGDYVTFPEKGLYLQFNWESKSDGEYSCVTSLTTTESIEYVKTSVKKLDEKYIPNTIARISDIPDAAHNAFSQHIDYVSDYEHENDENLVGVNYINAQSVGVGAFQYCYNLHSALLNNAKTIGDKAFYCCFMLGHAIMPKVQQIGAESFCSCYAVQELDFPRVTSVGTKAFNSCQELKKINLPLVTSISQNAFENCYGLTKVSFPLLESCEALAFSYCSNLTYADMGVATSVQGNSFVGCNKLKTLILRAESVCTTGGYTANNNLIVANNAYVYVPKSVLSAYKTHSHWKSAATQFRALEDYTVDSTITGELDESKI